MTIKIVSAKALESPLLYKKPVLSFIIVFGEEPKKSSTDKSIGFFSLTPLKISLLSSVASPT